MKALAPIIVIALLAMTGCREEPQILENSNAEAAKADQKQDARRQRTLRQSESERIY